jgi:hypothetical protein
MAFVAFLSRRFSRSKRLAGIHILALQAGITQECVGDMSTRLQLTICDLRDDCVTAIRNRFAQIESVKVLKKDIIGLRPDARATAGNSFGDMGGGVDRAIDAHFSGRANVRSGHHSKGVFRRVAGGIGSDVTTDAKHACSLHHRINRPLPPADSARCGFFASPLDSRPN